MMRDWERADPEELAKFDPKSKECTMNCGPTEGDPRSAAERKLLCTDCEPAAEQKEEKMSGFEFEDVGMNTEVEAKFFQRGLFKVFMPATDAIREIRECFDEMPEARGFLADLEKTYKPVRQAEDMLMEAVAVEGRLPTAQEEREVKAACELLLSDVAKGKGPGYSTAWIQANINMSGPAHHHVGVAEAYAETLLAFTFWLRKRATQSS